MSTLVLERDDAKAPAKSTRAPGSGRLADLAKLAAIDIETGFVSSLSHELHTLFDPVCDDTLPIYFGPLLGRLYLEGL